MLDYDQDQPWLGDPDLSAGAATVPRFAVNSGFALYPVQPALFADGAVAGAHPMPAPADSFSGTPGNDVLTGTAGPDSFDASQGGNDTIVGDAGNDFIQLGAAFTAADSVDGGADTDTVVLQGDYSEGVDFGAATMTHVEQLRLMGAASGVGSIFQYFLVFDAATVPVGATMTVSARQFSTGNGMDVDASAVAGTVMFLGGPGNDFLTGGAGDDYFSGRGGADVIDGGAGTNRVSFFSGASNGVSVDLGLHGIAQDTGWGSVTLTNVQDLSGTIFADTLTGDSGDNWILGTSGNDVIDGGGGNDLIDIGGYDFNNMLPTNVTVQGGDGIDTLSFYAMPLPAPGGVTLDLSSSGPHVTGQGTVVVAGIENLQGTPFADQLTGDDGNNTLFGAGGGDTLSGGAGDDILYGDKAFGEFGPTPFNPPFSVVDAPEGGGNDVLVGGDGNDILVGGAGDDSLDGGSGIDTAVLSGNRSDYAIAYDPATLTFTVADQRGGSPDGTDTIKGVENFQFADGTMSFAQYTVSTVAGDGSTTRTTYDAVDVQTWASQTVVTDAQGSIVSQTVVGDSGGQWVNTYDPHNEASWLRKTANYDAGGHQLTEYGVNDDGAAWLTLSDAANAYGWATATIAFDDTGHWISVTGTNDDGSHTVTAADIAAAYDTALWFTVPYEASFASAPPVFVPTTADILFG